MGLFSFLKCKVNRSTTTNQTQIMSAQSSLNEKDQYSKWLNRNTIAKAYEENGEIEKAIDLYEKNISEDFDGNFPYDRLSIIYRKRKQIDEEIRVLEKAIWVFENKVHPQRSDRQPKINKFRERLNKVHELKNKK